jgi:hypothetical protein
MKQAIQTFTYVLPVFLLFFKHTAFYFLKKKL